MKATWKWCTMTPCKWTIPLSLETREDQAASAVQHLTSRHKMPESRAEDTIWVTLLKNEPNKPMDIDPDNYVYVELPE